MDLSMPFWQMNLTINNIFSYKVSVAFASGTLYAVKICLLTNERITNEYTTRKQLLCLLKQNEIY